MKNCFFAGALLFFVALTSGFNVAHSQEAAWRLTSIQGRVRLIDPNQTSRNARPNEVLPAGTVVTTGAESGATIENGLQRIVMSANSRMSIAAGNSGMTRVIQSLGSIFFQVDHRQSPHFRVETPLLAAVVKGTAFTVSVTSRRDAVSVRNGLVEVEANQGGATRSVPGGQTVQIAQAEPMQFTGYSDSELRDSTMAESSAQPATNATAGATRPRMRQISNSMDQKPFLAFMGVFAVIAMTIGFTIYFVVSLLDGSSKKKANAAQRNRPAPAPPPSQPETLREFFVKRAVSRK